MTRRNKGWLFLFPALWINIVRPFTDGPAVSVALTVTQLALLVPAIYVFVVPSKEEKEKRRRELEKQKTLALEKELGFEPINFAELTDDQVHQMHDEMKKEKDR